MAAQRRAGPGGGGAYSCDGEDAGGEPREGEREGRGGGGGGREGAARLVGDDAVRAVQAAVEQGRMSMKCVTA